MFGGGFCLVVFFGLYDGVEWVVCGECFGESIDGGDGGVVVDLNDFVFVLMVDVWCFDVVDVVECGFVCLVVIYGEGGGGEVCFGVVFFLS